MSFFQDLIQITTEYTTMGNHIRYLLISAIAVMLVTSCKDGAEGPQGSEGPQGVQGAQGEKGDKGDPGVANVIYSEWTGFVTTNWELVTEFGRQTRIYEIAEPAITEDIMNTGVVLVYLKFGGAPSPRPLPYTGFVTTTAKDQHLWFRLATSAIAIVFHNLGDNLDPGSIGTSNQYRFVIIPGGVPVNGRISAGNELDLSYQELCRRYQIPE